MRIKLFKEILKKKENEQELALPENKAYYKISDLNHVIGKEKTVEQVRGCRTIPMSISEFSI